MSASALWVLSGLLSPASFFHPRGEEKERKKAKIKNNACTDFKSHLPNAEAKGFPIHHTHKTCASCGVRTYITSTVISVVSHISAAPLSSADEDVVNYSCLNGGPWPPVCSFMHTFIL